MANRLSMGRRVTILVGLVLTLVLPLHALVPGAKNLILFPGLNPQISHEVLWWALFAVVLLYVLIVERKPLSSIGLRKPGWRTFAIGAGAAGVIVLLGWAVAIYVFPLLHLHANTEAYGKLASFPYGLRVALVVRAAVVEETLFRGYGIERLQELTGSKFIAGAVTLAAFTLAHLSYWGWAQVLIAGTAGLVLTVLYIWRRDLGMNMVAHFVVDGASLLLR